MLGSLYIRDYALIDELEVDFTNGLNIITGETGAGKSILIGALKLILGERAASDAIRTGARKAVVEGVFDVGDLPVVSRLLESGGFEPSKRLILRREVTDGHSRAFINDSPATVQQLRAVASELVDLHGQHEHQSLLYADRHVGVVDAFGGLGGLLDDYGTVHDRVASLVAEQKNLKAQERELQQQKELFEFQIEEIDRIAPEAGEEETLEAERRILENAERLFLVTSSLFELLYEADSSVNDQLVRVRNDLQDLARVDAEFDDLLAEILSAQLSVEETSKSLQDYNSRIEFNPARLEEIRERLMELDHLKRRYGGTLEAVLDLRSEIGEKYRTASDFEGSLARLEDDVALAQSELSAVAYRLSGKRREVAGRIEASVVTELEVLGIQDGQFEIRFERRADPDGWILSTDEGSDDRYEALPDGLDIVAFYISTNLGEPPKPLVKVASGGEISRIMLALKTILARNDRLPILVFDEIDQGISGSIASRVGERMHVLGQYHQIIAITHLPQVAAMADTHFKVEKSVGEERTSTRMRKLGAEERRAEIAGLLSGDQVTEAALESAAELIEIKPEKRN